MNTSQKAGGTETAEDWRKICRDYHRITSYDRATLESTWKDRTYDRANRPETYLNYPDASATPTGSKTAGLIPEAKLAAGPTTLASNSPIHPRPSPCSPGCPSISLSGLK